MVRKRQHSPPSTLASFTKRLRTMPECFTPDEDELSFNPFEEATTTQQKEHVETVFHVPELLNIIFSFLYTPPLISVMTLVCKSWYATIFNHNPSILTRLYLDPSQMLSAGRKQSIRFMKRNSSHELLFKHFSRNRVELFTSFPKNVLKQQLVHVKLCSMHFKGFEEMLHELVKNGYFESVKTFMLDDIPFINAIEHAPRLCQQLQQLTLSNMPNLEQRSVKMMLAHASQLNELNIRNCSLNHFQRLALPKESPLMRNFETLPSLKKLFLEGCTASLFRTGKTTSIPRDGSPMPLDSENDSCHEFAKLESMHLIKFTVTRSSGSAPELFYTPKLIDLNLTDIQFHQGIIITDDPHYQSNIVGLTTQKSDDRHKPVLIQSQTMRNLILAFDGSVTVNSPTSAGPVNSTPVQTLIQCPELHHLTLSRVDQFYRLAGIEQCANLRTLHVTDWNLFLHVNKNKKLQVCSTTKKLVFKMLEELTLIRFSTTTHEMPEWDCPRLRTFHVTCHTTGGLREIKCHFPLIEKIAIHIPYGPCEISLDHLNHLQTCDIQCAKLRDLRISRCNTWLTNERLEQIIQPSPFLETLILNHCDSLRYVNVKKSHCSKLTTFAIRHCLMVASVHIPAQTMSQFYAVTCPRLQLINLGTRKEDIGFFRISGISNIYRTNYITI
jgi:hypothetical protein